MQSNSTCTLFKNILTKTLRYQSQVHKPYTYRCVLLRHGESEWNSSNRFTGWTDVGLSEVGKIEAHDAGLALKQKGFHFDIVYTSMLKRTIDTYKILAESMGCSHLPVIKTWRLNERHYGALQGFNKSETAQRLGHEQVKIWRRCYDVRPPALDDSDPRHPRNDPKYQNLPKDVLPAAECLKDTVIRVLPFWYDYIATSMLEGKNPLVILHGHSTRAIIKHLNKISDNDIIEVRVPTGIPLVYEFDENLKPIRSYYLAEEAEVKRRIARTSLAPKQEVTVNN